MAKSDHCPICTVAVKPENLLRHLNDTHPRHPDTASIVGRLKEERRTSGPKAPRAPIRIRRWQVGLVLGIAAIVLVGYVVAPYFDPYRNFGPDSCIQHTSIPGSVPYHMHPYLTIRILGNPQIIPDQTGITPSCMHPIHVHEGSDGSGRTQLHVETPIVHTFYLRDFFYIWGQPFNPNQILGYTDDGTNHVRLTVNGTASSAYENLALWDGQEIVISYGP